MSGTPEKSDTGKTSGNELVDERENQMTVDLEIKVDESLQNNEGATNETVEVNIEGLPSSVENVEIGIEKEKDEHLTGIDNDETEKEVAMCDIALTDTCSIVDKKDDAKKSASCEDLSLVDASAANSQEQNVEVGNDANESKDTEGERKHNLGTDTEDIKDIHGDGPTESITDLKLEENTEDLNEESNDDIGNGEGMDTPDVTPDTTPTKATEDQLSDDTNLPSVSNLSQATKKSDALEQEPVFEKPFPESLAKLRNLTVNIGPIRQMDLKSGELHEILKLTDNFEIKFELREKKDSVGNIVQEKSGFVRLPFEITTPTFLIRVAYRLGNLQIDGRDMSVKFPDAFNTAVMECKQYIEDNRKFRAEKFEQRKRQIAVKNVPPNVTEDTMRSLFPEAQKITLNMEELPDGGKKVGSVLLDFDTEEACVQCLDTNKDVFVEDCQLKIFRLFSDKVGAFQKKYKNFRALPFTRGRGLGRGRGMALRGNYQAAKIRNRAIGFGSTARGRGGVVKRGGNFGRKLTNTGQSSAQTGMKSPTGTNVGPPENLSRDIISPGGRGQRSRTFSGSKPAGKYQKSGSYEGQFKDYIPKREFNRGRQRTRPGRGRGHPRSSERSPSFRGEQPKQSPYRGERSSPYRSSSSYRNEQRYSTQSSSREEDPMAMMEYLKSTIARMEEKMTGREHDDRGYDNRHKEQSRSSQYSPRGRGNVKRGRGRGWGDQNRKRPADNREYVHEAKRQFTDEHSRRDSRNDYHSSQHSTGSGHRRDSYGNSGGASQNDYRYERDLGNAGDSYGSSYEGEQSSSYGNRGGSDYSNTGDRYKRENYGQQRFNSGYSGGGGQFGSRGGGRGQSPRGRGYYKGNKKGQW